MIDPVDVANTLPCGGPGTAVNDEAKTILGPLLAIFGLAGSLAGFWKTLGRVAASVLAYSAFPAAVIAVFGLNWHPKCRKSASGPNL